jgi:hypothetical protein
MRGSCVLVTSVIGILVATTGIAAPACSPKDAEAADVAVDSLNTWQAVQVWHRKHAKCDDGSIAEGSSEAIAKLPVGKWDTLSTLAALIARDAALEPFVIRHIDVTLDPTDLERTRNLSASSCPLDAAALCRTIHDAAVRASH